MTSSATPYSKIIARIKAAEVAAGRSPNSVRLIGVSKHQSIDKIETAFEQGLQHVGENYLQEAIAKIQALNQLPLEWHFIGHIQSNKTATIAQNFDWIHSIDRLKIARRLDDQRSSIGTPIKVFIQVNLDDETSKSGINTYNEAVELAQFCLEAQNLELQGLMSIPKACHKYEDQLASFQQVADFAERIKKEVPMPNNLSMGMSNDLEAAIAAGATHVRVGTALFGSRS